MTAISFPPQPQNVGNTYAASNGVTYVWTGVLWAVAGASGPTGNITFSGNTIATSSGGNLTLQAGDEDWTFDIYGSVTTPSAVSSTFTLTCDASHYVPTISKPTLNLTGSPWAFAGQFVYKPDGTVELQINNIFPQVDNPGYTSDDEFTFDSSVTGVPGYTLSLTLTNVVLPGGAGWTANPAFNPPPPYQSTVQSQNAIKITSQRSSTVFGADGNMYLPSNSGAVLSVTLNPGPSVGYYSASDVPTAADTGTGTGMTLDITTDYYGGAVQSVTVNRPGHGYAPGDVITIAQWLSTGTAHVTVATTGDGTNEIQSPTNMTLSAGGNPWTFGTDSTLNIPGTIAAVNGTAIEAVTGGLGGQTSGLYLSSDPGDSGNSFLYATNDVYLRADNNGVNRDWIFDRTGNLTLPQGGSIGNIYGDAGLNLTSPDGTYVTINSYLGNAYVEAVEDAVYIGTNYNVNPNLNWLFDPTGNLILPAGGTINWNNGSNALTGGGGGGTVTWASITNINNNLGPEQIAIGLNAGTTGQATEGIALGYYAGNINQGTQGIAIGSSAGQNNQGASAIAIGAYAGQDNQPANSIILNATGTGLPLEPAEAGLYVLPVRNDTGNVANAVFYNTVTNELTYSSALSLGDFSFNGNTAYCGSNITLEVGLPPVTIAISGADFVSVNLTYDRAVGEDPPKWVPPGYNPASDPYILFDGEWGIYVPGFGQALYVNTGPIYQPLAQWNINPPLGSVPPTGVYTYSNLDWKLTGDGKLVTPGNLAISGNTYIFGSDVALIQPEDNRGLLTLASNINGTIASIWLEDINSPFTSNIAATYCNPVAGLPIVRIVVGQNGITNNIWDFGTEGGTTVPILSAAPASPILGTYYTADGISWDPAAKSGSVPYPVFWDGVAYNALY